MSERDLKIVKLQVSLGFAEYDIIILIVTMNMLIVTMNKVESILLTNCFSC